MELQGLDLEKIRDHVLRLDKFDYAWWRIGVSGALVIVGGVLAWFAFLDIPSFTAQLVILLLYALAMTIGGFNIYSLLQNRDTKGLHLELLLETVAKEVERLTGIYDPLTRVYNRQCMEELVTKEISRSERFQKTFAVMLIDLNGFKGINDRLGHVVGDFVLAEMGQILRASVRGCDLIIRYGGDEFVLVLAETDLVGSEVVARRIDQRLAHWNTSNKAANVSLSVSIGVSIYSEGRKLAEMINEADQQMYASKRAQQGAATESRAVN